MAKKPARAKAPREPREWSDATKVGVGAAIGSAAIVAALLYAGKRRGRGRAKGEVPPAPHTAEATD